MWRKGAAQEPAEPARPDAEPGGAQKPACFSYPGERDVIRKIRRHVALSYGPHFCIGAATARLQARIALEELIGRCPDFRVDFENGNCVRRYVSMPFSAGGAL